MCKCLKAFAGKAIGLAELLAPLALFAARIWVGLVFFRSGMLKISNWEGTLQLFETEYKVPLIPHDIAAYMGTAVELGAPILLFLGLGARLGAVALLFMTAVIQFTYTSSPDHLVWALFLFIILTFGPGRISFDYYIRRRLLNHESA